MILYKLLDTEKFLNPDNLNKFLNRMESIWTLWETFRHSTWGKGLTSCCPESFCISKSAIWKVFTFSISVRMAPRTWSSSSGTARRIGSASVWLPLQVRGWLREQGLSARFHSRLGLCWLGSETLWPQRPSQSFLRCPNNIMQFLILSPLYLNGEEKPHTSTSNMWASKLVRISWFALAFKKLIF